MRIDEMDFRPRRLFAFVTGASVAAAFGVLLWVFAVNIYGQWRATASALDRWGWVGGGLFALALALLLLHAITPPFRVSFAEGGVSVRSVFGRRFVPWAGVQSATVAPSESGVSLLLRAGRLRGVSIPVGSYGRGVSLDREVAKRLPVPVNVLPSAAHLIAEDKD